MGDIGGVVLVIAIVLISTVLHELAHGWVAYWLGDDTAKSEGRLSLNPMRHIDPITSVLVPVMLYMAGGPIFGGAKPVPVNTRNLKFKEWGMALVALAGPLTNFLIALIAWFIGLAVGAIVIRDGRIGIINDIWGLIVTYTIRINLGFCIFNLIPFPPLDGSRILYAIAPDGVRRAMEYLEVYGVWLVLVLVWVFGSALSVYMSGAVSGILRFFIFLSGGGN